MKIWGPFFVSYIVAFPEGIVVLADGATYM